MLTVKQAAARAGVSVSLIYQLCDERRLPHYRPGGKGKRGKILISPRDLDAFMESIRVESRTRAS
jgi:excisionase family DNA binding protein